MSIVASTTEEICHSPTNNSRAKMLYSFPRSSRFPKDKENQYAPLYSDVIASTRSQARQRKEPPT